MIFPGSGATMRGLVPFERRGMQLEVTHLIDALCVAQRLSATGSFVSDLLLDQHAWSDELYRICEFEPGSHVTIGRVREIVHPEDVPSFETALARGLAGTGSEFVFRIVTSRGDVKHLRSVAHRVEQIADRPVFVGAIQDMTVSKVAEHALNV